MSEFTDQLLAVATSAPPEPGFLDKLIAKGKVQISRGIFEDPTAGDIAKDAAIGFANAILQMPAAVPVTLSVVKESFSRVAEDVADIVRGKRPSRADQLKYLSSRSQAGTFEIRPIADADFDLISKTREAALKTEGAKAKRRGRPLDSDVEDLFLLRLGAQAAELVDRALPADPRLQETKIAMLSRGLGSAIGFVGIGFATGGSVLATAAAGITLEVSGNFKEARARGATDNEALEAALYGIPGGAIEAHPAIKIWRRFNKASGGVLAKAAISKLKRVGQFFGGVATGAAEEGAQEFAQSLISNEAMIKIGVKERNLVEDLKAAGKEGEIGGYVGAIINTIVLGAAGVRRRMRINPDTGAISFDEGIEFDTDKILTEKPSRKDFVDAGLGELVQEGGVAAKAKDRQAIKEAVETKQGEQDASTRTEAKPPQEQVPPQAEEVVGAQPAEAGVEPQVEAQEEVKGPGKRVGLQQATETLLDIERANTGLFEGGTELEIRDVQDEPAVFTGLTFRAGNPATRRKKDVENLVAEIRNRLPKHLRNKVFIVESSDPRYSTADGEDIVTRIGDTEAVAQTIIKANMSQKPESRAERVAERILKSPKEFAPENVLAAMNFQSIVEGNRVIKAEAGSYEVGTKLEINGEEHTVTDKEEGFVTLENGLTLTVPESAIIAADAGSVQEGAIDVGDTSFEFGANVADAKPKDLLGETLVKPKKTAAGPQLTLSGKMDDHIADNKAETKQRIVDLKEGQGNFIAGTGKPTERVVDGVTIPAAERVQREAEPSGEGRLGAVFHVPSLPGRKPKASEKVDVSYWPSERVQARIEKARGITEQSLLSKVGDIVRDAWHGMTRPQKHLPKNKPQFASANEFFRLLKDVSQSAQDEVNRTVGAILKSLEGSPEDFKLFTDSLIIDNQYAALERGEPLRFGFANADEVAEAKAKIDALVANNPRVKSAHESRAQVVRDIAGQLVEEGLLPESVLANVSDYFHQQVLQYLELGRQGKVGGGVGPRPSKRSFQKRRVLGESLSEEYDYNTSYIESEVSWFTDAMIELKKADLFNRFIEKIYNILPSLKSRAKTKNFELLVGGPSVVAEINALRNQIAGLKEEGGNRKLLKELSERLGELDPTQEARRTIAIGMSLLGRSIENTDFDMDDGDIDMRRIAWIADQDHVDLDQGLPIKEMDGNAVAIIGARTILKGIADRNKIIKEGVGNKFVTWEDFVPDGHQAWQPEPGNVFYQAFSINEKIAEAILKGELEGLNLAPNQVRKILAMGGPKRQLVVPVEIADQLDDSQKRAQKGPFQGFMAGTIRAWKVYTLLNPKRALSYMLRNMTGDIDPVIGGAAGLVKFSPRAMIELNAYRKKSLRISPMLKKMRDLGVVTSSMTAQEMPDLKNMTFFLQFYNSEFDLARAPARAVGLYFETVKDWNEFRENMLRASAFMYYQKNIHNTKHYGGANPKVVRRLLKEHGADVAAAHLARNLLGDYGNLNVMGEWMRAKLFPFWSWVEVNAKRYPRMALNAVEYGKLKGDKRLAARAVYTGMAVTALSAMYAAQWTWNHLLFADEEDDLGTFDQQNPHIVLGRNADGSVNVFRNVGASGDFLEWFGINTLLALLPKYVNGELTGSEIALEMLKDPPNKFSQGIGPQVKLPFELFAGRSFFPDAFNPRKRDRMEIVAGTFGLVDEYRDVKGKLLKTGERARPHYAQRILTGVVDPRQSALGLMYDLRERFLKREGRPVPAFSSLPSLFTFMRRAAAAEDFEAFVEARKKFVESKKDPFKSFRASVRHLDPISEKFGEDDERKFEFEFLSPRERLKLKVARDYANELSGILWHWWDKAAEGDSPEQAKEFSAQRKKFVTGKIKTLSRSLDSKIKETASRRTAKIKSFIANTETTFGQASTLLRNSYKDRNRVSKSGRLTPYGKAERRLRHYWPKD